MYISTGVHTHIVFTCARAHARIRSECLAKRGDTRTHTKYEQEKYFSFFSPFHRLNCRFFAKNFQRKCAHNESKSKRREKKTPYAVFLRLHSISRLLFKFELAAGVLVLLLKGALNSNKLKLYMLFFTLNQTRWWNLSMSSTTCFIRRIFFFVCARSHIHFVQLARKGHLTNTICYCCCTCYWRK